MLPVSETLRKEETAALVRNLQRRVDRLETLEAGGNLSCLATTVLSAEAASVTFSSIDQSFRHLWLWIHAGMIDEQPSCQMELTFNADLTANYRYSYHRVDTAVLAAFGGTALANFIGMEGTSGNTAGDVDNFGACEINIMNYAQTTKRSVVWKAWSYVPKIGAEGPAAVVREWMGGGQWRNTADAISSLTVTVPGTCRMRAGSVFTLIGVC